LRELAHRLFLLFRELVRHVDLYFDDQIAGAIVFLDSLPGNAKPLSTRRTGRNSNRDFLSVERLHADLRAQRRLRDVDLHRRDDVEPFAPEEPIRLDLKRDQQIARRPVVRAASALSFQPNLRTGVHARRNRDHHLFANTNFARAAARRTLLARNRPFAQTHRARALYGESALTKRNRAAALTLGARLNLRAGGRAAAMTRRAFLVDLELDRHLAAHRRHAKRHLKLRFDVGAAFGTARTRATERRASGATLRTTSAGATTEATERTELAHLVVLFALVSIAQDLIRLRDLLEALGGLGIVRVFVRVMLRGELPIRLLDLVLRRRRRNSDDGVVILRLGHIVAKDCSSLRRCARALGISNSPPHYVVSRSTASR